MRVWRTGERGRITVGGCSLPFLVILASPNGKSLALAFDGILAGHVGSMPVLLDDDDGVFRSILSLDEVVLTELDAA